ncbi:MAG: DUF1893 domain-containing protein [Ruminococcaceae bacterium]|nr:DUF1893 domain-containing protein [Oscillospiraceae bacterium]
MNSDIERLKEARIALTGAVRCAVYNEAGLATSTERGIRPMILWLEEDPEFLRGASVADKIVGRAAAMIMVYGGVREVYASVVSNGAIEVFREAGIACTYSMSAIAISNRRGDGICPMERLVAPIKDPKSAYEALRNKVLITE